MANREVDSFVPGIEDIINGGYIYEDKSGNNVTALSFDQKKARGEIAVEGLRDYKVATETGNDSLKLASLASLNENFEYFGYSFLEKAEDSVPPVALTFYAFRVMVILGGYFILFFIAVLFLTHKNRILQIKENLSKWILYILILGIPMV